MATCVISGTVKTAAGVASAGRVVRIRMLLPPISSGAVAMEPKPVETQTGNDGTFSLTATQGATARLEIPSCLIDVYGAIPAESTATLETILASWENWEP